MEFNPHDIEAFMETIWSSMLQLPLSRGESRDWAAEDCLVATVRITGAWHGVAALACRRSFALRAAGIMFRTDDESLTDVDVKDALAELSNVIGGQLKSFVAMPSALSLPCIDNAEHFIDSRGLELARLSFECEGEPLLCTVSKVPGALSARN
jgi:chemotaxis protein CheX